MDAVVVIGVVGCIVGLLLSGWEKLKGLWAIIKQYLPSVKPTPTPTPAADPTDLQQAIAAWILLNARFKGDNDTVGTQAMDSCWPCLKPKG